MNAKEIEILRTIKTSISQRDLASKLNISLGKVNQIINELKKQKYILSLIILKTRLFLQRDMG